MWIFPGFRLRRRVNRSESVSSDQSYYRAIARDANEDTFTPHPPFVTAPPLTCVDTPAIGDACVICLVNTPNCKAVPCGCKRYCVECSRKMVFGMDHAAGKYPRWEVPCAYCRHWVVSFKLQ